MEYLLLSGELKELLQKRNNIRNSGTNPLSSNDPNMNTTTNTTPYELKTRIHNKPKRVRSTIIDKEVLQSIGNRTSSTNKNTIRDIGIYCMLCVNVSFKCCCFGCTSCLSNILSLLVKLVRILPYLYLFNSILWCYIISSNNFYMNRQSGEIIFIQQLLFGLVLILYIVCTWFMNEKKYNNITRNEYIKL